ncbi:hypothetical protein L1887_63276 [Cichorium endivia]|nr:hypothetical protein L1887_63276 [Cichorium endivia]
MRSSEVTVTMPPEVCSYARIFDGFGESIELWGWVKGIGEDKERNDQSVGIGVMGGAASPTWAGLFRIRSAKGRSGLFAAATWLPLSRIAAGGGP